MMDKTILRLGAIVLLFSGVLITMIGGATDSAITGGLVLAWIAASVKEDK